MSIRWVEVAQRVGALIRLSNHSDLRATAARLGLSEQLLKQAIDDSSRVATITVISAVIRVYGLDPSWVLTGKYNSATHRVALQHNTQETEIMVRQLVADSDRTPTPIVVARQE